MTGVLLAAGLSSRMGRNKLLLPWRGVSLLRHAATTALHAGLDLLVVLGHERDKAAAELAGLRCEIVYNEHYARGVNTSLRAGIDAVQGPAAVVLLADMPLVTPAMIRALVDRWQGEPLVISTYGGIIAPPTLYARALFDELLALPDDTPARRLVESHRHQALEIIQPPEALADIDTPSDV